MVWKSVATRRRHSRIPPFAKNAKDGPPTVLLMPARSKAWATPPPRSVSQHRPYATEFAGDQWKPVAELETSKDLSHLQCTDVRRFRNSPTESPRRFLHSFLSPGIRPPRQTPKPSAR